jgi:hypothetical protein
MGFTKKQSFLEVKDTGLFYSTARQLIALPVQLYKPAIVLHLAEILKVKTLGRIQELWISLKSDSIAQK